LELSSLLRLLDVLEAKTQVIPVLDLIKTALDVFQSRTLFESESESILEERLPQLLSLRSMLPDFSLLEDLIAVAIEASLPIGLDGSPLYTASAIEVKFRTIVNRSNSRWPHRTRSLAAELNMRQFLVQNRFRLHCSYHLGTGLSPVFFY
jgi:nucleolar pre-ribosomal-associated protein 1